MAPVTAILATVSRLLERGDRAMAAATCRRLLARDPADAESWRLLALAQATRGQDPFAALAAIRRSLALAPARASSWSGLGSILLTQADGTTETGLSAVIAAQKQALCLDPTSTETRVALGNALRTRGNFPAALEVWQQALDRQPAQGDVHYAMGEGWQRLRQDEWALAAYRRALALYPTSVQIWHNLGMLWQARANYGPALACARRAVAGAPLWPVARAGLGAALHRSGHLPGATRVYRQCLALDPRHSEAYANLAGVYQPKGRLKEATALFRQALRIDPDNATAWHMLGTVLQGSSDLAAAETAYRRALTLAPSDFMAHSNLLMCRSYDPAIDLETLFDEYRAWERHHAEPCYRTHRPHDNSPEPDRRLRIGYVSADFRTHSMARSVEGWLAGHDRENFAVYCYAEVGNPDAVTDRFRALADGFCSTVGLTDAQAAARIRRDAIDILVIFGAHMGLNRLRILAYRPAPIQMTFAGLSTTGLSVVDYILTDAVVHPPDSREHYTEQPIYLPRWVVHQPPQGAPDPQPLDPHALDPAETRAKRPVTFGSFNNPSKLTPPVIALWARILRDDPDSRLMLKYMDVFGDPELARSLQDQFAAHGIAPERLDLRRGVQSTADHLALLHEVDIALDPFPFSGCTTTLEALWMGVPVVSMVGDRFLARMGASFLQPVGLADLATAHPDAYVHAALSLAADPQRRAELRRNLRPRVARSAICDVAGYVAAVEAAYRRLWHVWCQKPDSPIAASGRNQLNCITDLKNLRG